MKTLGSFIDKKKITSRTGLDEKSVFYIFSKAIKEEYGNRGAENITPIFFRDKKIFLRVLGSLWENEISINKSQIMQKANEQLGGGEIVDLIIER